MPTSVDSQAQVDELWDHFCQTLHSVMCQACIQVSPNARPQRSQSSVLKNRVNLHRTEVPLGPARNPGTSFQERRLRNLAYKLGEMHRLEVKGQQYSPSYFRSREKVENFPDLPAGTTCMKSDKG